MLDLRGSLLPVLLAAVLVLSLLSLASATAQEPPGPDGQIAVTPGNNGGIFSAPSVEVGARSPNRPDGASRAGTEGPPPPCELVRLSDEETRETWASGHSGSMPAGFQVFLRACGGLPTSFVTTVAGPAATPAQLAELARAQLVLSLPVPHRSPDLRLADGRAAVVVGAPTWVWTEPASFRPLSRRVDAGPVWALVTARPVALDFDAGDGSPAVSCAGPGTAFDRSRHGVHEASPDCGFVYARSSLGRPNDQVTATYAIRWQVSWVGATAAGPADGVLPELVSRATSSYVVAEAQALRTG